MLDRNEDSLGQSQALSLIPSEHGTGHRVRILLGYRAGKGCELFSLNVVAGMYAEEHQRLIGKRT
jgi:hypothetical protein